MTNHEDHMRIAIEEARAAEIEGNPAVGSVIVRDGKIIARGHNLVSTTLDVTAHAETVALRNAGPATGAVEFPGATLYTTFQPCPMCLGAIMVARISVLVLGGRDSPYSNHYGDYSVEKLLQLAGWSNKLELVTGVLAQECEQIFNEWQKRRG